MDRRSSALRQTSQPCPAATGGAQHAISQQPADGTAGSPIGRDGDHAPQRGPLTVLIVAPTLDSGAADVGVLTLTHILVAAGHRAIVVSRGGRIAGDVAAAGGELVHLDLATKNPITILRNAIALARLVRRHGCDLVHAHGRTAAWSGYLAARFARVPFLTTWYKGFREQNVFKRLYNSVMVRGDRVVTVSEQLAELIAERHCVDWKRIAVVPTSVDIARFDPAAVAPARIETIRRAWGVGRDTRVILATGRMLRRKGHHVVVKAVERLKAAGLKDFLCVFVGEDQGRTRYTGELWDLVIETGTADVIRLSGPVDDVPAAYAAATVVVSAAIQPEGLQRAILEAQAMERPVVVSDLGAGPEVVLAPPAVPEDRMTGLRIPAGSDAPLAAALIRLFSLPETARRAIGARGRAWMAAHFGAPLVAEQTLTLYADVMRRHGRP